MVELASNWANRLEATKEAYTEGTEPGFGYGPLGMFIWLQP